MGERRFGDIVRDTLGEGTCESKNAVRQWGVNLCCEASLCLARPSGLFPGMALFLADLAALFRNSSTARLSVANGFVISKYSIENVFFIPRPSLAAEKQGPELKISSENENFKSRMIFSSENGSFMHGGMFFFSCVRARMICFDLWVLWEVIFRDPPKISFETRMKLTFSRQKVTNPGTTPITISAVDSDHGLSFAREETRTMV